MSSVLVKCVVAPATATAQASVNNAPHPEGGWLLYVALHPLNLADGPGPTALATVPPPPPPPPPPQAVLHLRDADEDGEGGGLWRALVRCGELAAGRQPRAAPPTCTPRSISTTLKQLKQAPLVLGIDLYKPGYKPGVAEVVAVFHVSG